MSCLCRTAVKPQFKASSEVVRLDWAELKPFSSYMNNNQGSRSRSSSLQAGGSNDSNNNSNGNSGGKCSSQNKPELRCGGSSEHKVDESISAAATTSATHITATERPLSQSRRKSSASRMSINDKLYVHSIANNNKVHESILGIGSTAIVVRAFDNRFGLPVAIKLYKTKGLDYESVKEVMKAEVDILHFVKDNVDNDVAVKLLGIVSGQIPKEFWDILPTEFVCEEKQGALGIVMRFEEGGTLEKFIHPDLYGNNERRDMPIIERIQCLMKIARCVANLHDIDIIHSDLKPANIFLANKSADTPFRLGDFDQAMKNNVSTAVLAAAQHGTLVYMPPELLEHIQEIGFDMTSRRGNTKSSDVYSFAIICWEILCRDDDLPFANELEGGLSLTAWINQVVGVSLRPSLLDLTENVPQVILDMMTRCWNTDPTRRLNIRQCSNILEQCYYKLINSTFDVFLSYPPDQALVIEHLKYYLAAKLHYKVYVFDDESVGTGHDSKRSKSEENINVNIRNMIRRSKMFIACVTPKYAVTKTCMAELTFANRNMPIVTLNMKSNFDKWITNTSTIFGDLKELLHHKESLYFDIGGLCDRSGWRASFLSRINPFTDDIHEISREIRGQMESLFDKFGVLVIVSQNDICQNFIPVSPKLNP